MNWRHKDVWSSRGNNFCVEVSRHEVLSDADGPHRWCVYAYIYPQHKHFAKFDGFDFWQDATGVLECHSYVSLLKYNRDEDEKVASVQVGWDYNHDGDSRYTHLATKEDAFMVFGDALRLYEQLAELDRERME
jgi:hypothetical protein